MIVIIIVYMVLISRTTIKIKYNNNKNDNSNNNNNNYRKLHNSERLKYTSAKASHIHIKDKQIAKRKSIAIKNQ